jgi:hypothetical protein
MNILNFILKRMIQLGALLFVMAIIGANIRLYYKPKTIPQGNSHLNADVLAQLKHLKKELRADAANEMQQLYPEGAFFMTVLYGLTWADLVENTDKNSEIAQMAETEMVWAIHQLDSGECKFIFNPSLLLPYGAFYRGWTGYLMGQYCKVFPQNATKNNILQQFQNNCDTISNAFIRSNEPYLESYANQSWPADNILCLASISLHDKILQPRYLDTQKRWLDSIQQHLDPNTGLIPHSFDLNSKQIIENARGCSQSMMLSFLPVIDSGFSHQQFALYQKHFLMKRMGIWSVREYPHDVEGNGDVDSGPVIFGVGGAASIVGIRAAGENNRPFLHHNFRNAIEMLCFPSHSKDEKYYLFKQLAVVDAFIAWVSAKNYPFQNPKYPYWQWQFHLWSLLIISVPCYYLMIYFYKFVYKKL